LDGAFSWTNKGLPLIFLIFFCQHPEIVFLFCLFQRGQFLFRALCFLILSAVPFFFIGFLFSDTPWCGNFWMISKDMHPYFFYLWLEWSDRLKLATPDCKKSNEASATQGIGARSRQFGDYASANLNACSRRRWTQA